jgi:hypothetical protein
MRRLLALGVVVIGGVIVARRFRSEARGLDRLPRATIKQRMMARMMEGLPADSPPKLVMSILPRLRQQNDEIIALLREQNELLRRGTLPVVHESESPRQGRRRPSCGRGPAQLAATYTLRERTFGPAKALPSKRGLEVLCP